MTNADRDRSIEHLLRRSFRPDQEAQDGVCPDAETLAALADYADAVLGATVRRDIEAHVAGCHRCQALMAAMVRAEPAAGPSADESALAVAWWTRRPALKWLATAVAATTVIALWVAVPGQRAPRPEEPRPEQQTTAAPSAKPASEPPPAPFRDEPRSRPDGARANADTLARAGEPASTLDRAAPAESRTDEKPEAPPQGSLEESSASKAAAPRDENRNREARESGAPVPGRVLGRQAAPAAAALAMTDASAKRAAAVLEVMSSDPQIRWRVGPGSTVQFSADGGTTWALQQVPTGAALTAGSSPAPTVCWLVGGAGTVLRTTDGGRRWQRVPFPETVDLISVVGSTALAATVDLADGRRFRTSDGGQSWAPVLN